MRQPDDNNRTEVDAVDAAVQSVTVTVESVYSPDATRLIRLLSTELAARYADFGDDGSGSFSPDDVSMAGGAFFVARQGVAQEAVGCSAVRPLSPGAGEIKRMFVLPQARGNGIARRLLTAMELWAGDWGYDYLRLETGTRQPEAIALYERSGYIAIAPFGEYADHPLARFYEKSLR